MGNGPWAEGVGLYRVNGYGAGAQRRLLPMGPDGSLVETGRAWVRSYRACRERIGRQHVRFRKWMRIIHGKAD